MGGICYLNGVKRNFEWHLNGWLDERNIVGDSIHVYSLCILTNPTWFFEMFCE